MLMWFKVSEQTEAQKCSRTKGQSVCASVWCAHICMDWINAPYIYVTLSPRKFSHSICTTAFNLCNSLAKTILLSKTIINMQVIFRDVCVCCKLNVFKWNSFQAFRFRFRLPHLGGTTACFYLMIDERWMLASIDRCQETQYITAGCVTAVWSECSCHNNKTIMWVDFP